MRKETGMNREEIREFKASIIKAVVLEVKLLALDAKDIESLLKLLDQRLSMNGETKTAQCLNHLGGDPFGVVVTPAPTTPILPRQEQKSNRRITPWKSVIISLSGPPIPPPTPPAVPIAAPTAFIFGSSSGLSF